jgi:hypothetical protein
MAFEMHIRTLLEIQRNIYDLKKQFEQKLDYFKDLPKIRE